MSGVSISWSVVTASPIGASPAVSARASDSLRSALHGRRNPGLASVVAMRWDPRSGLGWGCSGCVGIVPPRVGPVESARGTSGVRRSYRWRTAVREPVVGPHRDFASTMRGHGTARSTRTAAARPAHLRHRPLQLPLHVLHAQGSVRSRLRVPAARPGPELRGDRARGPGVRRARRREAAHHRAASRSSGATCPTLDRHARRPAHAGRRCGST